jgi:ABC-2 type transport system permease protein
MSFKRIFAIFARQYFLLRHNPVRFVNIFLWMVIDIILWGFITKYLDYLKQSNFSFTATLFGAVILWGFFGRVQQGVMVAFMEDMWTQNFVNIFASPIKTSEYVFGLIASSIATSALGFALVIALSGIFFGFNIFKIGLFLFPFLLTLFIFGLAMGILTVAIILRFGPSAEWLVWPIPALMSPLVGIFYPVSILPKSLQLLSLLLPPSYVFESMRSIIISGNFSGDLYGKIIIGLSLSIFYLLMMYFFFNRTYKTVLRNGLLSRFSAESSL